MKYRELLKEGMEELKKQGSQMHRSMQSTSWNMFPE